MKNNNDWIRNKYLVICDCGKMIYDYRGLYKCPNCNKVVIVDETTTVSRK